MVCVHFGILQLPCLPIRPPDLDSLNAIAIAQTKVNRTGMLTIEGLTSNDVTRLLTCTGSDDDPDADGRKVRSSLMQSYPDPVI